MSSQINTTTPTNKRLKPIVVKSWDTYIDLGELFVTGLISLVVSSGSFVYN